MVYILFFRKKRKKAENAFDRSLLGELDHALLNANSIIRINYLMVAGFLIPVFALSFSKMIFEEASPEKWIITAGMLLLALFVVRWEQKSCNLPGRRQLLSLRKKLTEE